MKLNAFTSRDLYRMKALAEEARRSSLDLSGLLDELAGELARRAGDAELPLPSHCPSCRRGRVVLSAQAGIRYQICVNGHGKAGCGWSRVI